MNFSSQESQELNSQTAASMGGFVGAIVMGFFLFEKNL